MARRQHQGPPRDAALELAEGDDGTGEGDRADEDAEKDLDLVNRLLDAGERDPRIDIARDADEDRGEADEAVEDGDQLRHLGHGDARRHQNPYRRADHDRGGENRVVADAGGIDRRGDGDRHADDAVEVAPPRRLLMAEAAEAENEQYAGADIGDGDEAGGHVRPLSSCGTCGACAGSPGSRRRC